MFIVCRGLFIIDPNGVLKHVSCNDLPVGRSVDEAFRLVQAFQFVEKHGEGKHCLQNATCTLTMTAANYSGQHQKATVHLALHKYRIAWIGNVAT